MIEYTVKVYESGTKKWRLNGKLHREDGPAIEHADGTKMWWLNGEPHREDGPAVVHADGTKAWWLNGKLIKEEFDKRQNSCDKVVEIDGRRYKLTLVD